MGKILLMSWSVPPGTTGSAVIVANLAKQFSRHEMVVVGEKPSSSPPVAWKEDWPEIKYVTRALPPTARGARWWRWCQLPLLIVASWYVARTHRCSDVLVVFPNREFLFAGYLTARFTKARLYPYFHNTFLEQCGTRGLQYRLARWLQERVFKRASHVFLMSDGMVDLYRRRYPKVPCSSLVHSFNEDIPDWSPPPQPQTPMRFVMSGNINASCADAASRLCTALGQIESRLTILSGTPPGYLTSLGILRPGVTYDTVSRDLLLGRLAEADIVLLAHGFTGGLSVEEYETIFPTKTIEYLICGRPILAHAPPHCFLTRFLREHACALVVDTPSVDAVLDAAERLRTDAELRASLVRKALRTAKLFQGSRVGVQLRGVLGLA